jgi:hypothetical protein
MNMGQSSSRARGSGRSPPNGSGPVIDAVISPEPQARRCLDHFPSPGERQTVVGSTAG